MPSSMIFSIATFGAKLVSGLIVYKIYALYVGPEGFVVVGNVQNILNLAIAFSGGCIATGISSRYSFLKENRDKNELADFRTTILAFLVVWSVLLCSLVNWRGYLSLDPIFADKLPNMLVLFVPLAVASLTIQSFLISEKLLKHTAIVLVMASLLLVICTQPLVASMGMSGVVLTIMVAPGLPLAFLIVALCKERQLLAFGRIRLTAFLSLKNYITLGIITATTSPILLIMVRDFLIDNYGSFSAGLWQASNRISDVYQGIAATFMTVYILPRVVEYDRKRILEKKFIEYIKVTIVIAAVFLLAIYFMSDFVLKVLFTDDFGGVRSILPYQLVGDFFRVLAWLASYFVLGLQYVKSYILIELICSASYFLFMTLLSSSYAAASANVAYMISNGLFCLLFVLVLSRIIKARRPSNIDSVAT